MSKRKDRERALATGMHYVNGRRVPITQEKYPGDHDRDRIVYLRCTKCNTVMSESLAEEHFKKCWGDKVPCEKCGKWVPVAGCIQHRRTCKGKEVKDAN